MKSFYENQNVRKIINRDGNDITPKPLIHDSYSIIYDRNMTYLNSIISRQKTDTINFIKYSLKDTDNMENITFVTDPNFGVASTYQSVSCNHQLGRSSYVTNENHTKYHIFMGNKMYTERKITLIESETIFILKLLQLTQSVDITRSKTIETSRNQYQTIEKKLDSIRTVVDVGTQTFTILMKPKFTYLAVPKKNDCKNLTSDWVMYDAYSTKISGKFCQLPQEIISNGIVDSEKVEKSRLKFSKLNNQYEFRADQMTCLYKNSLFINAVRVMEQIICIKLHLNAQKCFRGLTRAKPYNLDSNITYSINYLWSYMHVDIKNGRVNSVCWNYKNFDLLAVSYGEKRNNCSGHLAIWNMKHHFQPERFYRVKFGISDIDWNHRKPNRLALGCYDGNVRIIDVSNRSLVVLWIVTQKSSYKFLRIWKVQWWCDDDHENIFTSNEDGKIFCSQTTDNDSVTEIMKVSRIDKSKEKINSTDIDKKRRIDMLIKNEPGAIVLQRHPIVDRMYLVGSDEGRIYKCSTIDSRHYIRSFEAHKGPVCSLKYSPFCTKVFLTTGTDWYTNIWIEDVTIPIIKLSTKMSPVTCAAWSPRSSTVIATCVKNEICLWDLKRSIQKPKSVKVVKQCQQLEAVYFSPSGRQIVATDVRGQIHVYSCGEMPNATINQTKILQETIEKELRNKTNMM